MSMKRFVVSTSLPVAFLMSATSYAFDFYGISSGMDREEVSDYLSGTGFSYVAEMEEGDKNRVMEKLPYHAAVSDYLFSDSDKGFYGVNIPPDGLRFLYNHSGELYYMLAIYSFDNVHNSLDLSAVDGRSPHFRMQGSHEGGSRGLIVEMAFESLLGPHSFGVATGINPSDPRAYMIEMIDTDLNSESISYYADQLKDLLEMNN